MKDIRLIAMDMDGTLLNSEQKLSDGNREALLTAAKLGVKLAICSGRMPGDSGLFALEHGLTECAILSLNGGYCMTSPMGKAFANHTMAGTAARQCIALLKEADVSFACFLQNRIWIFPSTRQKRRLMWGGGRGPKPGAPEYYYDWESLWSVFDEGVNKLVCVEDEPSLLAALREKLQAIDAVDVTSSWPNNLELMPKGLGKGHAVKELAEMYRLLPEQVMAIGDYDNDLSMITYAGYGVAMGNASPAICAAASYRTLTNDQDGVAAAIRRFVLP
ncbi:MAG: Cof-type HAD-IIB family hydrolase [Eubacteriales bacterium]|nr:Cof-type HAD-IIB family hydrolase [Eubacteriales bacterium]